MEDVGGAVVKRTPLQAFWRPQNTPGKPPSGRPSGHIASDQTGICCNMTTFVALCYKFFVTLSGYLKCTAQGALFHI